MEKVPRARKTQRAPLANPLIIGRINLQQFNYSVLLALKGDFLVQYLQTNWEDIQLESHK
jgi:hypothetical protein